MFAGEEPAADFEPQSGLHRGSRVKKGVTGTRFRFWPDRQIFTRDAAFTWDELVTRGGDGGGRGAGVSALEVG